ncbi:hypothetical protein D3C87_1894300 [compost metagenome]
MPFIAGDTPEVVGTYPCIAFADTLNEEGHIEVFIGHISRKSIGITWSVVTDDTFIARIVYGIRSKINTIYTIPINITHITWLPGLSGNFALRRCCIDFCLIFK